jgi:hypothetical protein
MRWSRISLLAGALCAISAGAGVDSEEAFIGKRRAWWAFQKPARPEIPDPRDRNVRTPVDAFLFDAMQANGVGPSSPANRETLLRRLTLDLTGLPPTPGEVDLFLRDRSPLAYEKVVDRLLASPHYGERWAQRWLDVVRYADTNGYELDEERPHAWRYRDYVVRSFNQDKPFDRFLREQIAGDELFPGDQDALIATGFHRAGPIHLVGGNQDEEMNRQEVLTEMAGAVGSVFLGLTVGCARCHNHKFDPILQSDYYRLQAIFAATEGKDIEVATPAERAEYEAAKKAHQARLDPIKKEIDAIEKPFRDRLRAEKKAKLEPRLREAYDTPEDKRTPEQKILAKDAKDQISPSWDEVLAQIPPAERERRTGLRRQMHQIELTAPQPLRTAYAVANMEKAPVAHILKIGDPHQKLAPVEPGLPKVFASPGIPFPNDATGRRSALADWLASPDHPLTARVMVNRIWQFRMGTGLVATPNDFGLLGSRPSNPKLLDFFATEFVARNWSVKAIDRMIVLSSAYRRSTATIAANVEIDPSNKLYWRMNRRRLEGEAIRDSVLAASGMLKRRLGGPPIRVPIEPEIYDIIFTEFEPDNLWPLPLDRSEIYRRGLYLLNKRTVRLPMFANFDQPDAMTSCPVRPVSTHALQALNLMNSDFMTEQSAKLAARVTRECVGDRECAVRRAYKLVLARTPKPVESAMAHDFFRGGGRLEDFCLAMLNRTEFVYIP